MTTKEECKSMLMVIEQVLNIFLMSREGDCELTEINKISEALVLLSEGSKSIQDIQKEAFEAGRIVNANRFANNWQTESLDAEHLNEHSHLKYSDFEDYLQTLKTEL